MKAAKMCLSRLSTHLQLAVLILCCAGGLPGNAQIMTTEDLQKQIATYEAALHDAQSKNRPPVQRGRIWSHLGTLYQDAARYDQSQAAYEHAMQLLSMKPVSQADLAVVFDSLGTLDLQMGQLKQQSRQNERR